MQKDSFYREILKINDNKLVDNLSKITEMRHLHKGEILIHEGEIQEKFVFLLDGILRGFFFGYQGTGYNRLLWISMRYARYVVFYESSTFPNQY